MSWVYFEYVNRRGKGAMAEWLDGLDVSIREDVKAALNAHLQLIRPMRVLTRPYAGKLHNKKGDGCDGLYELRFKKAKIQWRPIFCYRPGQALVLLAGAMEKGSRLEPKGICLTAHSRESELDAPGRLRSYDAI